MRAGSNHCVDADLPINGKQDSMAEACARGVSEAQVWNERAALDLSPRERMLAVVAKVAAVHGVATSDILTKGTRVHKGSLKVCAARHQAIAAVHLAFPNLSTPQLGRLFQRDHSTILHSLKRAGLAPIKTRRKSVGLTTTEGESNEATGSHQAGNGND